ncbi:MAG: hypothetical protein HUU02_11705 [Bacteroidetes bacterium]|nr:hypothetical protein [Bacteroidota bacterium]
MKKLHVLVAALLLLSTVSFAQLTAGKLAITTDPTANSLGAAYALSENMRIDAGLSLLSVSPPSPAKSATAIGLSAGVKMYKPAVENVAYYYGGKFSFSTDGGDPAVTALYLGVLAGAEYYFSPRFSLAGHANFGFQSAGAANKTTTIGTTGLNTVWTWWFN